MGVLIKNPNFIFFFKTTLLSNFLEPYEASKMNSFFEPLETKRVIEIVEPGKVFIEQKMVLYINNYLKPYNFGSVFHFGKIITNNLLISHQIIKN